ncbi:MAG TPA: SDR family oxidoreductase [Gemmatimonadales bacterium]|nr:SDR family oxidoreductase [Gemmatimonadales bacterium]
MTRAERVRLKPLDEQVVVITGASSGIGLVTAREAARRGARVVMVARNEDALRAAAATLRDAGGAVMHYAADVARPQELQRVADVTVAEFGRFDTWVNNAGVGLYGRLDELTLEDQRRLFETNFWGVVHGCLAALPQLRARGGALINVGSIVSDLPVPLQGIYVASKHAVKGYTDALRLELEADGASVSVTLVKPHSVDTPYFDHARNYMAVEPLPPPPVYAPETVARAILHCAEHPRRTVIVGGSGRAFASLYGLAPRAGDKVVERTLFRAQRSRTPERDRGGDNLYHPPRRGEGQARGAYHGRVRERSLYTGAVLHPARTALAAAGVGLAVAAGVRAMRDRH